MTKSEKSLGRKIGKEHYVELTSKAKKAAAEVLEKTGYVRIYEHEDGLWAKAKSREMLEAMAAW